MSNNAHELSNRLLNALDNNYNVVDMQAVNEIISVLERINITKELLETTRLGKHVNELRRKTTDQTLARRAKVLVKRWRDLVIPSVNSPGHTGSNRSSAERAVRRLGGTPLTSPALSRQVVSPAVPSPRPPSRPAWGGYESDSQDVILVDDDPPPPPRPAPQPEPHTTVKRAPSPTPLHDEKKAKRDKKPKKRRGYSRAGSGAEAGAVGDPPPAPSAPAPLTSPAVPAPPPAVPDAPVTAPWPARNGAGERRRNGFRRNDRKIDPYAALVNKMPPAGAKKVMTTAELLQQIQQRAGKPASPASPASPSQPDVLLIEPTPSPVKVESPLRNGSSEPRVPSPLPETQPEIEPWQPLEDYREHHHCTCGEEEEDENCEAKQARLRSVVLPIHVRALHNTLLPGINGTRAPPLPHQFAVRKMEDPERPGLFNSVVPLYKYSDYADDYCTKNMDRVPLCTHLPWTEFAPPPPDPPPPPSPPPIRPYPIPDPVHDEVEVKKEKEERTDSPESEVDRGPVEAEMVGLPRLEPSERLKAPILSAEEETQFSAGEKVVKMETEEEFECVSPEHRTVERTKAEPGGGRALYDQCCRVRDAVPYDYQQFSSAPVLTLPEETTEAEAVLSSALAEAEAETDSSRDSLARPARSARFAEWHECARLGSLIALPYVVID